MFEPVTGTIKSRSENLAKTFTESSTKKQQSIREYKPKFVELMNDKGMIAPFLALSLVTLSKPENESQFRLTKDPNSTKMNDFSINTSVPVTLYSKILTFGDSNKSFYLDGDLLKTTGSKIFS